MVMTSSVPHLTHLYNWQYVKLKICIIKYSTVSKFIANNRPINRQSAYFLIDAFLLLKHEKYDFRKYFSILAAFGIIHDFAPTLRKLWAGLNLVSAAVTHRVELILLAQPLSSFVQIKVKGLGRRKRLLTRLSRRAPLGSFIIF